MAEVPIPFSEPPYICGLPSPYYTAGHKKWQKACREFITENLTQYAWEWEKEEIIPEHVFKKFADANMLIPTLPSPLPVQDTDFSNFQSLFFDINSSQNAVNTKLDASRYGAVRYLLTRSSGTAE